MWSIPGLGFYYDKTTQIVSVLVKIVEDWTQSDFFQPQTGWRPLTTDQTESFRVFLLSCSVPCLVPSHHRLGPEDNTMVFHPLRFVYPTIIYFVITYRVRLVSLVT